MKKILIATIILLSLGSTFAAFAAEDSAKSDPNEAMSPQGADVGKEGASTTACKTCLQHLSDVKILDHTAAPPPSSSGKNPPAGNSDDNGSVQ